MENLSRHARRKRGWTPLIALSLMKHGLNGFGFIIPNLASN
jgi:hypothetical protein